ncbi:MAG: hypothetical protein ACYSWO_08540 [Planctomycetota bacterium]|jgi:hypothetical protein
MLLAIINCPASSDEPDVVVVQDLRHLERVLLRRAEHNGYGHNAVIYWDMPLDTSPDCRKFACRISLGDPWCEDEFVTVMPMVPGKTVVLRVVGDGDYYDTVD